MPRAVQFLQMVYRGKLKTQRIFFNGTGFPNIKGKINLESTTPGSTPLLKKEVLKWFGYKFLFHSHSWSE
ncbi:hypothetical protein B0G93_101308 [Bacillus sp. V-88]|nr:hypothetical protein B0G93_101308 [Bacillus sp. V-88]SLJ97637.1 hypothetical protein SAMN06295884_101308 [Bacillus sp. V-88]